MVKRIVLAAWLLLAGGVAWAGEPAPGLQLTIQLRTLGGGLESKEESEIFWSRQRWLERSAEAAMSIDLESGRITLVDHELKVWCGGEIDDFLAGMERDISRLARRIGETYRTRKTAPAPAGTPASAPEVRLLFSGSQDQNGAMCLFYRVFAGEELRQEMWLDPRYEPGRYFDLPRLLSVLARFQAATAAFDRELKPAIEYEVEQNIQKQLQSVFPRGLEILSREYRAGSIVFEKRVTSIKEWRWDDRLLKIPEGYRQVPYKDYLEATLPAIQGVREAPEK